ncbi:peptidylprolyl isomerase [Candidatus Woesearchaeota archaeon]|nr:peptidylprolyl isomerase [Candidatus Woesearchaeota archaeon]
MEAIKEKDFVELDYTGRIADSGDVFDTTSAEVARKSGLFDERTAYGPAIICIGKKHLIQGLDKQLVGKEVGKSYAFRVGADEAFGRKNAKLMQLISTSKFRQQNLTPFPGMQVNIDGIVGTVKTVAGGRTIVDFNHPLSGRDVEYDVFVKRVVTDVSEKVKAMLRLIGITADAVGVSVSEGSLSLEFPQEVPAELKKDLEDKLKAAVPELKAVSFTVKAKPAEAGKAPAAGKSVETQQ